MSKKYQWKENHILVMTIENADAGLTFEKHLVLPEHLDYNEVWEVALSTALEYQDGLGEDSLFLLRGLTYLGYGIYGDGEI